MKHILIVNGNPDPAPGKLSSALAAAYCKGAEEAGHIVGEIAVGNLNFPMLRRAEDFVTEPQDDAIVVAQGQFLRASHVVFIFPLWLGGAPAMLKAFLEQLARGQFLLKESKTGFPRGGLKGRSASVIVTMGMPPLLYRTLFGARGVKAFSQGILGLAGFSPVRTAYFGGSQITPPHSARLVEKVRQLGRKAF